MQLESPAPLLAHVALLCRIARTLAPVHLGFPAPVLVLGSPSLRKYPSEPTPAGSLREEGKGGAAGGAAGAASLDAAAWHAALRAEFVANLRLAGDVASRQGVVIAIEPCPIQYGCDVGNTTADAAAIVREAASPGVRLHLDTGSLALTGETGALSRMGVDGGATSSSSSLSGGDAADPAELDPSLAALVVHVHISEPFLAALTPRSVDAPRPRSVDAPLRADHAAIERLLRPLRDRVFYSLEMAAPAPATSSPAGAAGDEGRVGATAAVDAVIGSVRELMRVYRGAAAATGT